MTKERLAELAGPIGEIIWSPTKLLHEAHEMATRIHALEEALAEIWAVASGEKQVAMDDTQGMEWITDYVSSVYGEQK